MGRARSRVRGEGNTEYVILLVFVLICAVVGLFTSYSNTIKKIQLEKGLCVDCTQKDQMASKGSPAANAPPPETPKTPIDTGRSSPMGSVAPDPSTQSWWESFRSFLSWW